MNKKEHNGYFEGILQLRNSNKEVLEATLKEIAKKRDVSVAKIKKVSNGTDIYISSQRFLRNLGAKLQKQFGGQFTISKKLYTKHRLTSKEVYRVNALLRLPNFKKGDVINYKGDKIQILGMSKKVLAKNLETGKKLNLSFKDLLI
jgi:nonsense-mediated mRNA decay protein 3|tara:strand:- start:284 stop:721 length:438 start_codon:yes stop_codon:yes gene_type:complete